LEDLRRLQIPRALADEGGMEESKSLPRWVRLPLIGLGLFLAGGLLSFGYSYRPLHGAMTWKVAELEERIDERNLENLRLGDELARLRSKDASRIDPDTFSQVERELDKTKNALAQLEKDRKRADQKRKDANASASRWRKRYEELRDQQPTAPASAARAASIPAAGQDPTAITDSPSESATDASIFSAPASPAATERGMLAADPRATAPAPPSPAP